MNPTFYAQFRKLKRGHFDSDLNVLFLLFWSSEVHKFVKQFQHNINIEKVTLNYEKNPISLKTQNRIHWMGKSIMIQKKYLVKFMILTILFLVLICQVTIQSACSEYKLIIGEELTYKVDWMHLRLGTVKIQVCDSMRMDNQKVYHARFFIDSNPLLFFINMHSQFECYLDENLCPHLFKSEEKVDGNKFDTNYRFDYQDNIIQVKIIDQKDSTKTIEKSIPLDDDVLDGISLIFYIRNNLIIPTEQRLNIIANGEKWPLDLKILDKSKQVQIKLMSKKFVAYEIEGRAHFTSTAGVTGKFRAWFAENPQNIPIMAEFKVFIGHVRMTLESWNNGNPAADEVAELKAIP